ncbi:hypothetical protein ABTY20_06280 [Streptomyces sp. NPDC126497]|uniref:hypothetical protein n=1 Tax=Streptomyces sp. NPDC126497 TaxID=3155313 RepID=UPI0033280B24
MRTRRPGGSIPAAAGLRTRPGGPSAPQALRGPGVEIRPAWESAGHRGPSEEVVPVTEYRDSLPHRDRPTHERPIRLASDAHATGLTASGSHARTAGSGILVGLVDELLAVRDGRPARGYGGTADVVACGRQQGTPVCVLWPEGACRQGRRHGHRLGGAFTVRPVAGRPTTT